MAHFAAGASTVPEIKSSCTDATSVGKAVQLCMTDYLFVLFFFGSLLIFRLGESLDPYSVSFHVFHSLPTHSLVC